MINHDISNKQIQTVIDHGYQAGGSDQVFQVKPNCRLVYCFAWNGASATRRLTVELSNDSEASIVGYFLGFKQDEFDIDIRIKHTGRDSKSTTNLRGALFDSARADFKGLIAIPPTGQGSNAWLEERVLVLSPKAKSESLPSLEIEANDVKAGHAATTGALGPDQVFYLMARGLPKPEAASILVEGHLAASISALPETEGQAVRQNLHEAIQELPGRFIGDLDPVKHSLDIHKKN